MIGKALKWLAVGGLSYVAGSEIVRKARAGTQSYAMAPGQLYAVVMHYRGPGAGGAVSETELQAGLQPSGFGLVVGSTATDTSRKLVTMLVSPGVLNLAAVSVPAKSLAAAVPAPWAPAEVVSVTAVGSAANMIGGKAAA